MTKLSTNVQAWLDEMGPWTEEDARERLAASFACACAGSPWRGPPNVHLPCYCELSLMKAQQTLGLLVVGFDLPEPVPPQPWPKGKPRPLP